MKVHGGRKEASTCLIIACNDLTVRVKVAGNTAINERQLLVLTELLGYRTSKAQAGVWAIHDSHHATGHQF